VNDLEREEQEALRKVEEIRRKKREMLLKKKPIKAEVEVEIEKTPSPKKTIVTFPSDEMEPKNLTMALKKETLQKPCSKPVFQEDGPTAPYFLQKLEETRHKQSQEKEYVKSIINSRIYTFDEIKETEPIEVDEKEFYSGQQISRRYVKAEEVEKFFEDKKVIRLPKLFAKVCPPNFDEPRYPNWLVIGIISRKTKPKATSDGRSKLMFLTLTDFKFSVGITMFGVAVEKYNKLRVGDVVAILNPDIYIKSDYTTDSVKTFALTIKHAGDCFLEIARSKYFGLCPALKKDGTLCGTPINKAFEECCLIHKELRIRKTAGKRMEFQTSVRVTSPTRNGRKQQMFLGKPDKGGFQNASIVIDHTAPKTDRISEARKHFSSTNKHEKFFNSEIEDPSDIGKKRMHQDQYRKRIKDVELQKKLAASIQGAKNLKKYNSVDNVKVKGEMSLEEKKALLKYAYSGNGLSTLGFDPTARGASRGILSEQDEKQKSHASATADELRNITKNKKIDFSLSKEEIVRRQRMKKEADNMLKKMKETAVSTKTVPTFRSDHPHKRGRAFEFGSDMDSDSDLEIIGEPRPDALKRSKNST
jgi:minichromosome maintenance protein 10